MNRTAAVALFESLGEFWTVRRQAILELGQPFFEGCVDPRQIEHQKADRPPQVALVLPADNAHAALKRLVAQPKLAVQGHAGQPGGEPIGGVVQVSQARNELLSVPVGPHSVELLAQPPVGQVCGVVPGVGQQQRRHRSIRVAAALRFGPLRQGLAEPLLLGRLAPQLPQVLARPAFDRQRLISPGGTGAGIDAAQVPQNVRGAPRALDLDRFAVM